jgi:predicted ATPase
LAAAAVDESFPARDVAEFVSRWGFFDPSPFLLRRGWTGLDATRFDPYGRNLAERLFALQDSSPGALKQIVTATQSVLGLPSQIELRESRESEDRVYFVQHEPGLKFPVHQIGASSGTLRMLALMTAIFGETGSNLIGIEEPENHVHPTALKAFAEYLVKARERVQILVTTHSPLLLDFLNDPGAVSIVRHSDQDGTRVSREINAEAVRQALEASGFGLGEFYETKGFGG